MATNGELVRCEFSGCKSRPTLRVQRLWKHAPAEPIFCCDEHRPASKPDPRLAHLPRFYEVTPL